MKKTGKNFGHLMGWFAIACIVALLVSCSAAPEEDATSGSACGSLTISGADTSAFGRTTFQPGECIKNNSGMFAWVDPVDLNLIGNLYVADVIVTMIWAVDSDAYGYHANCTIGDDCSGISVNESTLTVTFTNQVLPNPTSEATGPVTLNGTLTYVAQ
jgi:hypothetical protein